MISSTIAVIFSLAISIYLLKCDVFDGCSGNTGRFPVEADTVGRSPSVGRQRTLRLGSSLCGGPVSSAGLQLLGNSLDSVSELVERGLDAAQELGNQHFLCRNCRQFPDTVGVQHLTVHVSGKNAEGLDLLVVLLESAGAMRSDSLIAIAVIPFGVRLDAP